MQRLYAAFILAFCLLLTSKSLSQIATNDLTFNPTDAGFGKGDGPAGFVNVTSVLADGKILAAGSFTFYNQKSQGRIMRLDVNGNLDPAFITGTGFNGDVNTMVVQPDGKILVAGGFGIYNGQLINRIARLNADGTLDASFNPGMGANNSIRSMALQSDGKIIIAGHFNYYGATAKNFVARLNEDGTLDATYNTGTGPDLYVYSLALQSDGKAIIGGQFSNVGGTARKYIARLNSDGSLDGSFTVGTGLDQPVSAIALQSDAKILIGGKFTVYNGATAKGIARLNTDGTKDAAFTTSTQEILTIAIQSDNKIVIGGNFNTINSSMSYASLARLNMDGSVDAGFNSITAHTVYAITVQSDGKVLTGGAYPSYNGIGRYRLFRMNADGSQDLTFNPCTGADNFVDVVTVLPDNKILIGGAFNYYDGKPRNHIARLNADGTLDETFTIGTGTDGAVLTIVAQPDGKIIIGGQFSNYNGTTQRCITRLNTDGSLDATFNPSGYGVNGIYIRSILLQSDGKMVIGGNFVMYNNAGSGALARITATGAYDATFTSGLSNPNSVESIVRQADGKFIIAGLFTTYGGVARNNIARITSTGSLDASFNPGLGTDGQIGSIALQSDQKVVLGGAFTSFNGTAVNHLVRLNTDGNRDASFDAGAVNPSMSVVSILTQPDDKLLVTGYFTSYKSTTIGSFARLNLDGSLDANFIANPGSDNTTYAVALQSDGKIILAGAFASFNSTGRNRITRLLTTPCTPPTITSATPGSSCGSGSLTLNATASAGTVKWYIAANSGEPFTTGNSFVTPVLTSTTNYYVETMVANCPSGRTVITATINNPQVSTVVQGGRCDAGTVVLSATGNAGSTLKWYDALTNGTLLGTGTSFTTPVISTSTIYYVEAGVGTCVVAARRTVKATVNNTPSIATTINGNTIFAHEVGATYQWLDCNNGSSIISGQSNQSFTAVANGSYALSVSKNGCKDTSACVALSVTGNLTSVEAKYIVIYPNPGNGILKIQTDKLIESISITNPAGKLLESILPEPSVNSFDLSDYQEGMYFIHLKINDQIQTTKFVLQR